MKLLFDEGLSPKLIDLLRDLSSESESALRNGLAAQGDRRILEYARAGGFVLVSTDSDFEQLVRKIVGAKVVVLRSCNYPSLTAERVLRRNAIRIAGLPESKIDLLIIEK